MKPIDFNELSPTQILTKNKYYFVEYCNKGFSKQKLLGKFVETKPIEELELIDISRFIDKPIECLHFTNTSNVKTGKFLTNKNIKLYYFNKKIYSLEEIRWIYYIVTGWNWNKLHNYRIDECFIYTPMAEEIVLKKILNDPHFIWNH
jgi:hypothetical protein